MAIVIATVTAVVSILRDRHRVIASVTMDTDVNVNVSVSAIVDAIVIRATTEMIGREVDRASATTTDRVDAIVASVIVITIVRAVRRVATSVIDTIAVDRRDTVARTRVNVSVGDHLDRQRIETSPHQHHYHRRRTVAGSVSRATAAERM
jgi:hypothetical protein